MKTNKRIQRRQLDCNVVWRLNLGSIVFTVALICAASSVRAQTSPPPAIDDRWTVTINGQTTRVNADGTFRISNISAADLFGDGGPGTDPDFASDEWVQAVGTATIDGVTWYATSEPFQIKRDPKAPDQVLTYVIQRFSASRQPPADIPESIELVVPTDTLYLDASDGQTEVELQTLATFAGVAEPKDVTIGNTQAGVPFGTTYRSSNKHIADVVSDSVGGTVKIVAKRLGTAFITVTNRGATDVHRVTVTTSCAPTTLVGTVHSGGVPISGAIVITEGGSNSPSGTAFNGTFSFEVCFPQFTSFGVVILDPMTNEKFAVTDVTPIPNGVTDLGIISLGPDNYFWVGGTGDDKYDVAAHWHRHTEFRVPPATANVFINPDDFLDALPPDWPTPYTVKFVQRINVANFTLDSAAALLRSNVICGTAAGNHQSCFVDVAETANLISGAVFIKETTWSGGTLNNAVPFTLSAPAGFAGSLAVVNTGPMKVEVVSNQWCWISGSGTTFFQASVDDYFEIEGQLEIRHSATMSTTPDCKGINIGSVGVLRINEANPGDPPAVFNHNGGVIVTNNRLEVEDNGTLNLNGAAIDISSTGKLIVLGFEAIINLNAGIINNAGSFEVGGFGGGGQLNYNGGAILGNGAGGDGVIVDNGSVFIASGATAPARFTLRHFSILRGTVHPGQTVVVQALDQFGSDDANVQLTQDETTGTFTNGGTIQLEVKQDGGDALNNSELTVGIGNEVYTLRNDGTIEVIADGGGGRRIFASIENHGVLNIHTDLTLGREDRIHTYLNQPLGVINLFASGTLTFRTTLANPIFTNAADSNSRGIVSGAGTLDMHFGGAPRTFQNDGRVRPGGMAVAGELAIVNGGFTQSVTGILEVELGGVGIGASDKLTVSGNVEIGGTVVVSLLPGFSPAENDVFVVLTYGGTRNANVNPTYFMPDLGAGLTLTANFNANRELELTVVSSP